jgi:hypothetical protein
MKPNPPCLETWLLKHLVRGEDNEALAGDLLEEFGQGRSITWYRYQVLVAILLTLSKQLRARWICLLFAVVVSSAISFGQIWQSFNFEGLFTWGIQLPWPASLAFTVALWSASEGIILFVAFAVYLTTIRRFNRRNFLKGALVALVLLTLGNLALPWIWLWHPPVVIFYTVIWRLPLFSSLVLATWAVPPKTPQRESATRPA